MGLDMYGYADAERVEVRAFNRDGEPLTPELAEYSDRVVEARVPDGAFRPSLDGLDEGNWYRLPGEGVHWQASYVGYNRVRQAIALVGCGATPEQVWAKPNKYRDLSVFPLVNFSDCEGIIGPRAAARIAHGLQAPGFEAEFVHAMGPNFPASAKGRLDGLIAVFRAGSTGLVVFT